MRVYGKNVLKELLSNPKRIKKVYLTKNNLPTFIDDLKSNKIKFELKDNKFLDNIAHGNHQGIVIDTLEYDYESLNNVLDDNKIVILDHLTDNHNFGAIIRTCEALGVKAIIIPKDRSVLVNDIVMKTSAGSLNYVKIVMVSNIVNSIKTLKDNGYYIYGTDMDGKDYYDEKYPEKCALIIGSEGDGISALVKKNCDEVLSIPMTGKINSLNASVAAAIVISKMVRTNEL